MTEDVRIHPRGRQSGFTLRVWHLAAAGVIAVAIALVAWLVLRDGSPSSSSGPVPTSSPAVPISAKGLATLGRVGIPIYWLGQKPGFTYELTKTTDRVYIRYLPAGVKVGSGDPYLTVGTYPVKNAFAVTSRLAARSDSVRIGIGAGAVAFYSRKTPTNVYVAFRGSNHQIEVYDPSAEQVQQMVRSGEVKAVS